MTRSPTTLLATRGPDGRVRIHDEAPLWAIRNLSGVTVYDADAVTWTRLADVVWGGDLPLSEREAWAREVHARWVEVTFGVDDVRQG